MGDRCFRWNCFGQELIVVEVSLWLCGSSLPFSLYLKFFIYERVQDKWKNLGQDQDSLYCFIKLTCILYDMYVYIQCQLQCILLPCSLSELQLRNLYTCRFFFLKHAAIPSVSYASPHPLTLRVLPYSLELRLNVYTTEMFQIPQSKSDVSYDLLSQILHDY